jgi:hypothetical protein
MPGNYAVFKMQNLGHYGGTDMNGKVHNLMSKTHLLSGDSKELGSTQNPTYAWKKSRISDMV